MRCLCSNDRGSSCRLQDDPPMAKTPVPTAGQADAMVPRPLGQLIIIDLADVAPPGAIA